MDRYGQELLENGEFFTILHLGQLVGGKLGAEFIPVNLIAK
jgi:hypothetical protein